MAKKKNAELPAKKKTAIQKAYERKKEVAPEQPKKVVNLEDIPFANEDYNDLPSDFVIHSQWSQITRSQPRTGEVIDPTSVTVPGESMTVKEILKRHASGRPVPAGRMPVYDSDQQLRIPDLEKLDKMQVEDLKRQMEQAELEHQRKQKEIDDQLAKDKEEKYKQMEMEFTKLKQDMETVKKFENENSKNIS